MSAPVVVAELVEPADVVTRSAAALTRSAAGSVSVIHPDVSGIWTIELVIASLARVPVLGDLSGEVRSVLAARIWEEGGQLYQQHRVCTVELIDATRLVKTTLPAGFVPALPMPRFPVSWTVVGDGLRYSADWGRELLGWSGVGPVPADAADPRVFDADGDGQPGVTVQVTAPVVGTGEVYVIQAGHSRVSATGSLQRLEGPVDVLEMSQQVVGASSAWLLNGPQARPNPGKSRVTLSRETPPCAAPGG